MADIPFEKWKSLQPEFVVGVRLLNDGDVDQGPCQGSHGGRRVKRVHSNERNADVPCCTKILGKGVLFRHEVSFWVRSVGKALRKAREMRTVMAVASGVCVSQKSGSP